MDNITHSLIGYSVADFIFEKKISKKRSVQNNFRFFFIAASVLFNNLPDLDFIYSWITPGRLGSLLHHRGHTHTFLVGFLLTLLIWAFTLFLKPNFFSNFEKRALVLISLLGISLHIFADSWNSYGVHPFWPLNNNWFYGDIVFIIEPWIWGILLPILFFRSSLKAVKVLVVVLFLILFFLLFFFNFVPWQFSLFFWAFAIWFFGIQAKLSTKFRSLLGIATLAIFIASSYFVQSKVRAKVIEKIALKNTEILNDLVLTPMPANWVCWAVMSITSSRITDEYIVRRGMFSTDPIFFPVGNCPRLRFNQKNEARTNQNPELQWDIEFRSNLSELKNISKNCNGSAFLKFSRAPVWKQTEDHKLLLDDLRFIRDEKPSFSSVVMQDNCPRFIPDWHAPRSDLLD